MQKIQTGLEHLLLDWDGFRNCRIGLVTNNAALTSANEPGRVALLKKGFNIIKLFSPEHGLTAAGEDGAAQYNSTDPLTSLPVISLYGDHFMPTAEDLDGIDLVIFDIPDIGCRFYTYLWTMTYVMEACAMYNKPLVILDRPNPTGGNLKKAEGPFLDEKNCSSFIGRWSIPVRYCCTFGELAKYFSAARKIDVDLKIIPVTEWKRNQPVLTAENAFIPTSPAISNIETAICYMGTGLLEGINVNEGRGTPNPFRMFTAPWINKKLLTEKLNSLGLPGIEFSETESTPAAGLYTGELCFGSAMRIKNEKEFLPVHTGLAIVQQLLFLFPEYCTERYYKTAANPSGEKHLDKLIGIENSLNKLKSGVIISTDLGNEWLEKTDRHLLYN